MVPTWFLKTLTDYKMKKILVLTLAAFALVATACNNNKKVNKNMPDVQLMTLDPGHFHAALVQKFMYDDVSERVYVFAPPGPDVELHLARIDAFNKRGDNPTAWMEEVYRGEDFFEEMLRQKPGNVVVLSGNNAKKSAYILESVKEGINVLADKPMVIRPEDYPVLEKVFETAHEKGVLIYDIMTERYEINTMIQKALSQVPELFGELENGTPDNPAVTKESVHHFFKYVSGVALQRPPWFFDTRQQGEGIVDVTTHLVDLIQWECYPGVTLNTSDIEIYSGKRWPTKMTAEEFERVTATEEFPEYLEGDIVDGNLHCYANGEIVYKIKDTWAKVSVEWKYQAPEGTGDTHYSIMRGSRCDLIIKQGDEEDFKPALYIQSHQGDISDLLPGFLAKLEWEGITFEKTAQDLWRLNVPDKYKVGHEAHFGQVTEKFLDYLKKGKLPDWEVPNMLVKYYTTTEALKKAME